MKNGSKRLQENIVMREKKQNKGFKVFVIVTMLLLLMIMSMEAYRMYNQRIGMKWLIPQDMRVKIDNSYYIKILETELLYLKSDSNVYIAIKEE